MSLLELFCNVDDFMLNFAPQWKAARLAAGQQRERADLLWPSEMMTILIHFHQSHYRTFKAYDTEHVQVYLTKEFPHLVSYQRFVALIPGVMIPLLAYLQSRFGAALASASSTRRLCRHVTRNASADTAFLRLTRDKHGLVLWF